MLRQTIGFAKHQQDKKGQEKYVRCVKLASKKFLRDMARRLLAFDHFCIPCQSSGILPTLPLVQNLRQATPGLQVRAGAMAA